MHTHTYDEFPYLCLIRPDIHPSNLATLATLFNLQPPPVETGRILELGCGNGINLIATAQSLPQAQCLGIDYSVRQIADGQQIIDEVGLSNVTLKSLDILEFDERFGIFDYIVIHGVYSWVAEKVQEKLLSICQQHLSPKGIAYISYNTYPAWHINQIMRDMMQFYHVQQFNDLTVRPLETKQLLKFAVEVNQNNHDAYSILLQEQLERLLKSDADNYLRHDLLESENNPIYFYQFVERARQHQLEYVTDVKFRDTSQSLIEIIEQLFKGTWVAHEQYLDFLLNRKLRMTLLCRQGITVNRQLDSQLLPRFYLAATPFLQQFNIYSHEATNLPFPNGKAISITEPLTKAVLAHLINIYPCNIAFEELFNPASTFIEEPTDELKQTLATELLSLYRAEVISLNVHPTQSFTTTIRDYPTISPLARWQASQGQTIIVNLLGQLGQLDEFICQLLPHLNGENNREALLKIMAGLVKELNLTFKWSEQEIPVNQLSEIELHDILHSYLDETLPIIAKNALLI